MIYVDYEELKNFKDLVSLWKKSKDSKADNYSDEEERKGVPVFDGRSFIKVMQIAGDVPAHKMELTPSGVYYKPVEKDGKIRVVRMTFSRKTLLNFKKGDKRFGYQDEW